MTAKLTERLGNIGALVAEIEKRGELSVLGGMYVCEAEDKLRSAEAQLRLAVQLMPKAEEKAKDNVQFELGDVPQTVKGEFVDETRE